MDDAPVQLLVESHPCLVFNKPGGLLTQAPSDIDSLERRVRAWVKERVATTGGVYLGLPHRLDRPVSGVVVFARHVRAARRLADQFAARTVKKTYWVLVEGQVTAPQGTWRHWMRKVPDEPRAEPVSPDVPGAREGVLHYRVLRLADFGTWLEVQLETGRMHQIRLQCALQGHPVLGDELYGAREPFGPQTDEPRARWIGLHARHLALIHPATHEPLVVEAPLWPVWTDFRPAEFWGDTAVV